MGLVSPGGVHAHQRHIVALAALVAQAGVPVRVHAFLDGRDTPPKSAAEYLNDFIRELQEIDGADLTSLVGRYYAMDRDRRWDRVERAYDLLVDGIGKAAENPVAAIEASYAEGVTDEFVEPVALNDYPGMADGDGILCANFRADRVREILGALLDPEFDGFAPKRRVDFAAAAAMTEYSERLAKLMRVLFPTEPLANVLGDVVAQAGRHQLRLAETEKYPHVTFFLNGGEEDEFAEENRIMIASPKVATYDLKPEMSAPEVGDRLVAAIDSDEYDLIVVNFANPDMVGHTGDLQAAIRAVETVDGCVGRTVEALQRVGGVMLLTADHGNCELMRDPETGGPHTAHTTNPVPLLLVNAADRRLGLRDGRLADLAPTVLKLMGIPQPAEMTGRILLTDDGREVVGRDEAKAAE
jgi:2,3-bisphosphoglycerate-independent phosphoglycerate mutase